MRTQYPANVKDQSGRSDSVTPVAVIGFYPDSDDADGGAIPVTIVGGSVGGSGLTDAELRDTPVPVSGPATDAELRATALPVSVAGEIEVKNDSGNPLVVSSSGIGAIGDIAATGDTGDFSLIALFKRFLSVKLPTTLGAKTAALSLAVTTATDDLALARMGILTEAAPATDTASSGLNGRLQRIAQRLTSLIAQLPATLGIKTAALSLSVAPASDAVFPITYPVLPAGTDKSGTVTAVSGVFNLPANAARKGATGQNVSGVSIGFNEHGGVAVIGGVSTYTVPAGGAFSISTNKLVNFISAGGNANVALTEI